MKKICFVGAGRMTKEHLKVFSKIKNIKIAGITSRTIKKAKILQKNYPELIIYKSLNKMLLDLKPDGVVVSVSENSLKKLCRILFKFKCALLIEKPIGCNIRQNLNILSQMKKYKKKNCYVALNRRFFDSTLKLVDELKKDRGKRTIYINDQQYNLQSIYPHKEKIVIKNMMYANSVHLLDYINILGRGKIKTVQTNISKEKKQSFLCSNIIMTSGDKVNYNAIWNTPGRWGIRIFTDNFFYELSPLETLKIFDLKKLKTKKFKNGLNDINFKPGFMLQAIDFVKMIKKKSHSLIDIEDNFNTTKLINKIYENF